MKTRSLLIEFDETWEPTVFINGETDIETTRLKKIAHGLIQKIKEALLNE